MEPPAHGLREQVDAATAEHIANQVPPSGPGRAAMLAELLDPVVAAAAAACRAYDAWVDATDAQQYCCVQSQTSFSGLSRCATGRRPWRAARPSGFSSRICALRRRRVLRGR